MARSEDPLRSFGPVWDGAGARGFFGEGYWFHGLVPGLSFRGSTFVAKTATTYQTEGNMPLTKKYRPREWLPRCIWIDWREGMALNAVGLSGPGIRKLMATDGWRHLWKPFFLSYMPMLPEDDWRAEKETEVFIRDFKKFADLGPFARKGVGFQLNVTCPNVGADFDLVVEKALELLDLFAELGHPLVVKLNLLVAPEMAARIARHPACAGICMGNTIPFGTVLPQEWWDWKFRNGSPLLKRGLKQPGGLSGKPLLPFVLNWIEEFRELDQQTHVNAGGGILHWKDVDRCKEAGADSISVASAAMLRPWRLQDIIWRAHRVFA